MTLVVLNIAQSHETMFFHLHKFSYRRAFQLINAIHFYISKKRLRSPVFNIKILVVEILGSY